MLRVSKITSISDHSPSQTMKGANLRIYRGHSLVLPAPTTPHALTPLVVVAALGLVPLVVVASLGLAPRVTASLRASLSTSGLTVTSGGNAGSGVRAGGCTSTGALSVASSGNAVAVARFCGASGSGAVLSSGVLRGGGARAGAVELTLDEGKGVLAILFTVALVGGFVAAVTAVRVSAVAVRLHLGAGLLGIVSMGVLPR